ncbi:transposase [Acinetobacter bereziniae]|nr:transposase [Acinetobacter bereziniae]
MWFPLKTSGDLVHQHGYNSATPLVAKKRRTYSKEFKLSVVNACKDPNASIALKHGLNANLVSRWIRNFHHHDSVVQDPAHVTMH